MAGQTSVDTPSGFKKWLKRIGFAGFMFFLIKGLLWLVLFALLAFGFLDDNAVQRVKDALPF